MVFSIIIPVYNAASYIERCLNSVYNQNIEDNLFEVVIIDDGSPDNSTKIAETITEGKTNVKIYSQENKGLGGARNTGIEKSMGTYLIFLDADDYLEPNCLLKIYKKIRDEKFNNIDVFEMACNLVTEENIIQTQFVPDHLEKIFNGMEYFLNVKTINSACNKVYNKKSISKLRFKERIYSEDSEFNTRAFFYFKNVCSIDILMANFVQTKGSITRNNDSKVKNKLLQDSLMILRSFKSFEKNNSAFSPLEIKYFEKKYTLSTVNIFYLLWKYNIEASRAISLKDDLKKENLYCLSYSGLETKRNYFRLFLDRGFLIYFFLLKTKNVLST
ncbi:glycosyltransferase family 2 protein [Aequorivita sediminis]|uniref:glycosyltransferase family 2 protein n=1 Tax=Aequorivita sediminis TaxID=3073653 RepID=UPI0028A9002F|nr:glycosyltransferase family 2 protein [Aequorivita sp. F6058]